MASFRLQNLIVTIDKKGVVQFNKSSYPKRFGQYSEIRTPDYEFQFNLKGEVKSIRGLNMNWPHPSEILKRTDGNDWVYHSVGAAVGYGKIKDALGEYYLPCPAYPTNTVWEFNPYTDPKIAQGFGAWYQLFGTLHECQQQEAPEAVKEFIAQVLDNDDNRLHNRTETLHSIIGGEISVLPPDTRHVDYEVIPLTIADGCLYQCGFCEIKSRQAFAPRSQENIRQQLQALKAFYGENIKNYTALFLGNHDALAAGESLIEWSLFSAYDLLDLKNCYGSRLSLYLFGSVGSLLDCNRNLFETLNRSPFYTYINIGFESADADTLAQLKKPIGMEAFKKAFNNMLVLNRDYPNLEITANFLLGEQLSIDHNQALAKLLTEIPESFGRKGAVYLSPLMGGKNNPSLLPLFYDLKTKSRLPAYLYLIQRM